MDLNFFVFAVGRTGPVVGFLPGTKRGTAGGALAGAVTPGSSPAVGLRAEVFQQL